MIWELFFLEKQMLEESQNIWSASQLTKQQTEVQDQDHLDLVNLSGLSFPDMLAPHWIPYKANNCFPWFIVFGFLPWRVNQGNNFNFLCSGINFGDPSLLPLVFIYYLFVPLRKIEKKKIRNMQLQLITVRQR